MKKVLVLSLGGSVIIPENINTQFLTAFKKEIQNHYSKYKFVIVCGGGSIARKYMVSLLEEKKSQREIINAGIRATRMNALFLMQFFGPKVANNTLPKSMLDVQHALTKNNVVICGALRYAPHATSDSTAAKLAEFLKTEFINITNVPGLFTKDPKVHKDAKFIAKISWNNFAKKALARKYHPGQHFVLDQQASQIIKQHRINTYIIGPQKENLHKLLLGKPFKGTIIGGQHDH